MKILLDTSLLYALNDADDKNNARAVSFLDGLSVQLFLPTPVLPELCYLLHSRLGYAAMRRFLAGLARSDIQLVALEAADLDRINEVLATYADAELDFADAAVVALAERLDIELVATFDRRDFSIIRPQHCSAFQLLP